ncbi:MAG TPA: prephenate dehydrogenase [Streptosporangiaceae bacterium]|nr:prephenate dehydrogenase [Streptosporangiaceae bacterium]
MTALGGQRLVVLGAGLMGTSVALAAREQGARVWLRDSDEGAQRLAADLGAGEILPVAGLPEGPVDLAVLAMPPRAVAPALASAQARDLARVYTDLASVKVLPLAQARKLGCDLATYVAGHPLAGRERSGPAAARADLFLGRPWALCPLPQTAPDALAAVRAFVHACGAEPAEVDAARHDRFVALVSHLPQLVSAAMAARLNGAEQGALGLAGQGLRDVTRIAAGDARLWTSILTANAEPVASLLDATAADLAAAAEALREVAGGDETSGKRVTDLLSRAVTGVGRIPGKRGGPAPSYAILQVVIADKPGELTRLFQAAGDADVNIEDVSIEHSPGLPVGVAELSVRPDAAGRLATALRDHGWPVHD